MTQRTIAIVDGNSLIHRAFHALPPTMTAPDGRPTNAAFGFMQMLLKMIEVLGPDTIVVAWDQGRPAFRSDVLEQYKAHRPPTDPGLKAQFPMVRAILEAMRVPQVAAEGWEADDLLGTLSAQAERADARVLLVTGDRDAFQLVDERVSVVSTRKGLTDIVVYDPQAVFDRLGVTPAQVPDYLGLKGDTSDNIPGVPGVGEKTAAKLIAEHGSLDATLEAAPGIKGKLGENLREHARAALASREVATIRRDAPIDVDLASAGFGPIDEAALLKLFTDLQFTSLTNKVFVAARHVGGGPRDGVIPVGPAPGGAADGVERDATEAQAWEAVPPAEAGQAIRSWTAAGRGEWLGVALAAEGADTLMPTEVVGVAGGGRVATVDMGDLGGLIVSLLSAANVATGDAKALIERTSPIGKPVPAQDPYDSSDPAALFDCAIAGYLLESGRSAYDVESLYAEFAGRRLVASDGGAAAAEATACAELQPILRARLETDGSLACFETIEMPLVPVLTRMERVGVGLDVAVLEELGRQTAEQTAALLAEIRELADVDYDFNVDSPKQLAEVLFEKMGLPPGKRTKTGYSTDSSVLGGLAESFPIAGRILEYREITKLRGTYIEALPRLVGADGRLHTTFNQTVAATGRLSSSSPNLQNIPVRTELGRRIRAAFVPATGGDLIMSADYSQVELRILAHLSGDQGLIDAFTSGEDFHTATAARVFGVAPDQVGSVQRGRAKAVNFGIVYGQTAHGLSASLGVGRAEAQLMIDRYFDAYPGVRAFLDRTVADAHRDGSATTMFGRRRRIPELKSSNFNLRSFGERTAMNHPMQGSAADIMKLAMVEVDRELRVGGFASRMVLQVHDELVFEVPPTEEPRLAEMVARVMSGVVDLAVPLEVSVNSGLDWAAAK